MLNACCVPIGTSVDHSPDVTAAFDSGNFHRATFGSSRKGIDQESSMLEVGAGRRLTRPPVVRLVRALLVMTLVR